ncbi:hypothetical protein MRS76_14060 [Rhizobiaceae bacterium n13]|uniref:Uncharacterized protein n=1 Tax=Ferirhizobium litorale TaxID=2927786 RepID=A0AAE3QH27_9HYPH|nr:hypothetical protein [Fererhizobium litorale]MDI7863082.1 hypothetical protein [Fererhizobium litorale]MDI7923241.1 hypothetical protein [Fererhizobium litorale]
MQSVRSFFLTLSGITFVAIIALFTASITIALAGILSVMLLARALTVSLRMKPVPVRAKARDERMRVWNDGRGTIIDM